jgi:hypothetical protein
MLRVFIGDPRWFLCWQLARNLYPMTSAANGRSHGKSRRRSLRSNEYAYTKRNTGNPSQQHAVLYNAFEMGCTPFRRRPKLTVLERHLDRYVGTSYYNPVLNPERASAAKRGVYATSSTG